MSEATYRRYAPPVHLGLATKYLQRYTQANMTAMVEITRGTGTSRVGVYSGRARVHLLASPVQMGFGDEPQFMVSGTISVPAMLDDDATPVLPRVTDMVRVTAARDRKVIGRAFRVMHVPTGGLLTAFTTLSVLGAQDAPSAMTMPPATGSGTWPDLTYTADE